MEKNKEDIPGLKLFNALRVLEKAFTIDGNSVNIGMHKLFDKYSVPYSKQLAKWLLSQGIVKEDFKNSTHKNRYYYYNGERLSLKYCNQLLLQFKLDRSASKENPSVFAGEVKGTVVEKIVPDPIHALFDEVEADMIATEKERDRLDHKLGELDIVFNWLEKRLRK